MLCWKNRGTRNRSREVIIPLCSTAVCTFWSSKHRKEVDKDDWAQQRIMTGHGTRAGSARGSGSFGGTNRRNRGEMEEMQLGCSQQCMLWGWGSIKAETQGAQAEAMRTAQQHRHGLHGRADDILAAFTAWLGEVLSRPVWAQNCSVRTQRFPLVPTSLNRILWEMKSHTFVFFAKCTK